MAIDSAERRKKAFDERQKYLDTLIGPCAVSHCSCGNARLARYVVVTMEEQDVGCTCAFMYCDCPPNYQVAAMERLLSCRPYTSKKCYGNKVLKSIPLSETVSWTSVNEARDEQRTERIKNLLFDDGKFSVLLKPFVELAFTPLERQLRKELPIGPFSQSVSNHLRLLDFGIIDTAYGAALSAPTVEVLPVLETPIVHAAAISAATIIRKRGCRGGKKIQNKRILKQQFCYALLVPRSQRQAIKSLGPNPSANELLQRLCDFNVSAAAKDIQTRGVPGDYHFHIIPTKTWNLEAQHIYVHSVLKSKNYSVGSELGDLAEDEFVDIQHLEDFIRFAESIPMPEEEPVYVGGEGDCWKQLFPAGKVFYRGEEVPLSSTLRVTVEDLLIMIEKTPWLNMKHVRNTWRVKLEKQESGDFHIAGVARSSFLPGFPAIGKTLHEAAKNSPFLISLNQLVNDLRDGPKTKLVGLKEPSPMEKAIVGVSSLEARLALDKAWQPSLRDQVDEIRNKCPWYIPETVQHIANKLHCPWSSMSVERHSHPLHAWMRRWSYDEIAKHITVDTTCLGMKFENFQMLKQAVERVHGCDVKLTLVNPIIEIKDVGRYVDHAEHIPANPFEVPKIETLGLFCDESGHYLSPGWMLQLAERNPRLRFILMTNYFPLLSLEFEQSPEPDFVRWQVIKPRKFGDLPTLIYIPEGDLGGKYEQPFDPTMTLLRSVNDERGNEIWKGGVVAKKADLRLQVFTRYHLQTSEYHCELEENYVPLPRLFSHQPPTAPVAVEHFVGMLTYAKTVIKDDEAVQWGKLRTYIRDKKIHFPVPDQDYLIKVVLACRDVKTTLDGSSRIYNNLTEKLRYCTIGKIGRFFDKHVTVPYIERNRRIVSHHSPLYIWPALDVHVKKHADSSGYSINWSTNSLPDVNFWQKFRTWMRWLGAKVTDKAPAGYVAHDENGTLHLPFLEVSVLNYKLYGRKAVKFSQQDDFNKLVLKRREEIIPVKRKVHTPVFKPQINYATRAAAMNTMLFRKVGKEFMDEYRWYFEDWSEDLSSERSSSYETALDALSVASISTETLEVVEESVPVRAINLPCRRSCRARLPVCKSCSESFPAHNRLKCKAQNEIVCLNCYEEATLIHVADHCEICIPYDTYVAEGGDPDERSYLLVCEAKHAAEGLISQGNLRSAAQVQAYARAITHTSEPIIQPTPFGERMEQSPIDITVVSRSPIAPVIVPQGKAVQKHQMQEYLHCNNAKTKIPVLAERIKDWNKFRKIKPGHVIHAGQARGETLWDLMFPQTQGQRYSACRYYNIREWFDFDYPEEDCLVTAVMAATSKSAGEVLGAISYCFPSSNMINVQRLELDCLEPIACKWGLKIHVCDKRSNPIATYGVRDSRSVINMMNDNGHIQAIDRVKGMVIREPIRVNMTTFTSKKLMQEIKSVPGVEVHVWIPERKRAMDLLLAMKAGEVGTLSSEINLDALRKMEQVVDAYNDAPRAMIVFPGDPGCRKSSTFQKILAKPEYKLALGNFLIIMATNVLAQDWRDKLDATQKIKLPGKDARAMPSENCVTWEVALAKYLSAPLVVMDENKYPKGYMALHAILNPTSKVYLFMNDPWQVTWHNPKPTNINSEDILGEAELYMKYANQFLLGTWRFSGGVANFFRMPSWTNSQSEVHFSATEPLTALSLSPFFPQLSDAELHDLFKARHVFEASHYQSEMTGKLQITESESFSGSVGLTVPLAILNVREMSLEIMDPRMLYTPMTRSKRLILVYCWSKNGRNEQNEMNHPIFGPLKHYRQNYKTGVPVSFVPEHSVDIRSLTFPFSDSQKLVLCGPPDKCTNIDFVSQFYDDFKNMPFVDPDKTRVGARLDPNDPLYKERPDFISYIDPTPYVDRHLMQELKLDDIRPAAISLPTKFPPELLEPILDSWKCEIMPRELAELQHKGEYSDQFPDVARLRADAYDILQRKLKDLEGREKSRAIGRLLKNPTPDLLTDPTVLNLGMDQRAADAVSFAHTRKERLINSSYLQNVDQLQEHSEFGNYCWSSFQDYMQYHVPFQFDHELYEQCVQEFQERRGDRSEQQRKQSLNRADAEYGIRLIAKTQLKLKDREWKPAKPLQPVMIHGDNELFDKGPFGVYMLRMLQKTKPANLYLHAERTFEEMQEWQSTFYNPDETFELRDFKAQDITTSGWALVFITRMFEFFNLPQDFQIRFKERKLHKRVGRHVLSIMTDPGEIFTWFINTTTATAHECAIYNPPVGWPMQVSGDDLQRRAGLAMTQAYVTKFVNIDPMIQKRETTKVGGFCSYTTRQGVVYKDPILLLKRFLVKISSGKGELSALGYWDLWVTNYLKRESIFTVMTQEEQQAHQILTRIMFNLKKHGIRISPDWSKLSFVGEEDAVSESRWDSQQMLMDYASTGQMQWEPYDEQDIRKAQSMAEPGSVNPYLFEL